MAKSTNEGPNTNGGPNANGGNSGPTPNTGPDIRMDAFIRQVKPDPNNTEPVLLLHGYIGESAKAATIRVYSDPSLGDYVEIARADVLYSLTSDNDPLGGSTLWVKQSANMQYNNAAAYTQGSMYNDYMQNQYTPGYQTFGGGAQPAPITNPPNCVVLVSRVIRCTTLHTPFCPVVSRPVYTCLTRNNLVSICHPCIPTTYTNTITIHTTTPQGGLGGAGGGGVMNDPYGAYAGTDPYGSYGTASDPYAYGDYTGGDMYNDYMQNQYTPGVENFGGGAQPAPATNPPNCIVWVSRIVRCPVHTPFCPIVSRLVYTCLTRNNLISICHPCIPTTYTNTITIHTTTPQGGLGGAGGGGVMNDPYAGADPYGTYGATDPYAYGDYTGGTMYNDYMQNQYAPEAQGSAAGAQAPIPQPTLTVICRPTVIPQRCYTHPAYPPCRRTGPLFPPCTRTRIIALCPTLHVNCPSRIIVQCPPRTPQCPF